MSRLRAVDPNLARLDRTVATMTEAGAATPAKELVSLADTTFSTGLIERTAAVFASGPAATPMGEAEARWRPRRQAMAA
jgi:hypothetical protein